MLMLKVLKFTWPFFKEMIIGRNSLRYAMKKNRVKVFFFFAVILSFVVNWMVVPRLFTLSSSYLKIKHELVEVKGTLDNYKDEIEMIDQTRTEMDQLRARIKELETAPVGTICPKPMESIPNTKYSIDKIYNKLNSAGDMRK